MKKDYFTLLLFIILLLSFGCNNKSKRLQEEYSTFTNKNIKLPAFTKGIYKNKDAIYFHNDDVMTRMVVFFRFDNMQFMSDCSHMGMGTNYQLRQSHEE